MRTHCLITALALLVLPALACESGATAPLEPEATTGVWSGLTLPAPGAATVPTAGTTTDSVRLTLAEDGTGSIEGSATVVRGGATTVYRVSGRNFFPQVELTLDPGGTAGTAPLIQMRGEFATSESLRLQLFGGGFDGERVLLQRRPTGF